MASRYELWLYNQNRDQVGVLTQNLNLSYRLVSNSFGTLKIYLPPDFNLDLIPLDGRVAVFRGQEGSSLHLEGETHWLPRRFKRMMKQNGERLIEVTAYSSAELLTRRIVAYNSGTAYTSKTAASDDMMKAIVRENLAELTTDTARDINNPGYLNVAPNLTQGPSISKAFTRRNVLLVLQELAQQSATNGTRIYFDVVAQTRAVLEFRTYKNQRGADHTVSTGVNPVVFSAENGLIISGERGYDYTTEVTYAYAGGAGEGTARTILTASDSTRINSSPLNRREVFRDARNAASNAEIQAEADQVLRDGRPSKMLGIQINPLVASLLYGREWQWGDQVTVYFEGEKIDCLIDDITVTLSGGEERVDVGLRTVAV